MATYKNEYVNKFSTEGIEDLKQATQLLKEIKLEKEKIQHSQISVATKNEKLEELDKYLSQAQVKTKELSHSTKEYNQIIQEINRQFRGSESNINKELIEAQRNTNKLTQATREANQAIKNLSSGGEFSKINKEMVDAGRALKSQVNTFDQVRKNLNIGLMQTLAFGSIDAITTGAQSIYNNVKEIDSLMRDIRIVSNKSSQEMESYANNAYKAAQALGSTKKEALEASLVFEQQGGKAAQYAQEMRDATIIGSNITGVDPNEMSNLLTSLANGYKLYDTMGKETGSYITDVVSYLGAKTGSDFIENAKASSQVASTAKSAGFSFEEIQAYMATLEEITRRAPESVGNAMKSIIGSMMQLKEGKNGELTSKVNEAFRITGIGTIFGKDGEVKSPKELIEEVADKWAELDKNQQSLLASSIAGKQQMEMFMTLMNNRERVTENIKSAEESAGASLKQQALYMNSIEAKQKQLINGWQQYSTSVLSADAVKPVLDLLNGFLNNLNAGGDNFLNILKGALPIAGILGKVFVNKGITDKTRNDFISKGLADSGSEDAKALKIVDQLNDKQATYYSKLLKINEEEEKRLSNLQGILVEETRVNDITGAKEKVNTSTVKDLERAGLSTELASSKQKFLKDVMSTFEPDSNFLNNVQQKYQEVFGEKLPSEISKIIQNKMDNNKTIDTIFGKMLTNSTEEEKLQGAKEALTAKNLEKIKNTFGKDSEIGQAVKDTYQAKVALTRNTNKMGDEYEELTQTFATEVNNLRKKIEIAQKKNDITKITDIKDGTGRSESSRVESAIVKQEASNQAKETTAQLERVKKEAKLIEDAVDKAEKRERQLTILESFMTMVPSVIGGIQGIKEELEKTGRVTESVEDSFSAMTISLGSGLMMMPGVISKVAGAIITALGPIADMLDLFKDKVEYLREENTKIDEIYSAQNEKIENKFTSLGDEGFKKAYQNFEGYTGAEQEDLLRNGTEEQKQQIKTLQSTIASAFPDMVKYYDDQGNAIVDLNEKREELIKKVEKERLENQKLKADNSSNYLAVASSDYISSRNNVAKYSSKIKEAQDRLSMAQSIGNTSEISEATRDIAKYNQKLNDAQKTLKVTKASLQTDVVAPVMDTNKAMNSLSGNVKSVARNLASEFANGTIIERMIGDGRTQEQITGYLNQVFNTIGKLQSKLKNMTESSFISGMKKLQEDLNAKDFFDVVNGNLDNLKKRIEDLGDSNKKNDADHKKNLAKEYTTKYSIKKNGKNVDIDEVEEAKKRIDKDAEEITKYAQEKYKTGYGSIFTYLGSFMHGEELDKMFAGKKHDLSKLIDFEGIGKDIKAIFTSDKTKRTKDQEAYDDAFKKLENLKEAKDNVDVLTVSMNRLKDAYATASSTAQGFIDSVSDIKEVTQEIDKLEKAGADKNAQEIEQLKANRAGAIAGILEGNDEAYQKWVSTSQETVKAVAETYKIDLRNFSSLAEAKAAIQSNLQGIMNIVSDGMKEGLSEDDIKERVEKVSSLTEEIFTEKRAKVAKTFEDEINNNSNNVVEQLEQVQQNYEQNLKKQKQEQGKEASSKENKEAKEAREKRKEAEAEVKKAEKEAEKAKKEAEKAKEKANNQVEALRDEADKYSAIDRTLSKLERAYNRIKRARDNAYSKDKLAIMAQEEQQLKNNIRVQESAGNIYREEMERTRALLEKQGYTFDAGGTIANKNAINNAKLTEANNKIAELNKNASDKNNAKDYAQDVQEGYQNTQKLIKSYEEAQDKLEGNKEEVEAIKQQLKDIAREKWEVKINILTDAYELQDKVISALKEINDLDSDTFNNIGRSRQQASNAMAEFRKMQELLREVKADSSLSDHDREEKVKELQNRVIDSALKAKNAVDEANDSIDKFIEKIQDEFDKIAKGMDRVVNKAKGLSSMHKDLYGIDNRYIQQQKEIEDMMDIQDRADKQAIKFYQHQQKNIDMTTEKGKEQWDKLQDLINEKQDNIDRRFKESLDNILSTMQEIAQKAKENIDDVFNHYETLQARAEKINDLWARVYGKGGEGYSDRFRQELEMNNQQRQNTMTQIQNYKTMLKSINDDTEVGRSVRKEYMQAISELEDKLISLDESTLSKIQERMEAITEEAGKAFDRVSDNISNIISKTEGIRDLAEDLYGSDSEEFANQSQAISYMIEQQNKVAQDTINYYKELQSQLDTTTKMGKDMWYEMEEAIKKNADVIHNNLIKQVKEFEKQMKIANDKVIKAFKDSFGPDGLENFKVDFELQEKAQDKYLSGLEKMNELSSIRAEIENEIKNSNNPGIVETYNQFLNEQLKPLEEAKTINEHDLQILNRQLEVLRAKQALENQGEARMKARVVRDSQGNLGYQYYTEAEEKSKDSVKNYNDALKNLESTTRDVTKKIASEMQQTQEKMFSIMEKLATTKDKQERERLEKQLQSYQKYYDQLYKEYMKYSGKLSGQQISNAFDKLNQGAISNKDLSQTLGLSEKTTSAINKLYQGGMSFDKIMGLSPEDLAKKTGLSVKEAGKALEALKKQNGGGMDVQGLTTSITNMYEQWKKKSASTIASLNKHWDEFYKASKKTIDKISKEFKALDKNSLNAFKGLHKNFDKEYKKIASTSKKTFAQASKDMKNFYKTFKNTASKSFDQIEKEYKSFNKDFEKTTKTAMKKIRNDYVYFQKVGEKAMDVVRKAEDKLNGRTGVFIKTLNTMTSAQNRNEKQAYATSNALANEKKKVDSLAHSIRYETNVAFTGKTDGTGTKGLFGAMTKNANYANSTLKNALETTKRGTINVASTTNIMAQQFDYARGTMKNAYYEAIKFDTDNSAQGGAIKQGIRNIANEADYLAEKAEKATEKAVNLKDALDKLDTGKKGDSGKKKGGGSSKKYRYQNPKTGRVTNNISYDEAKKLQNLFGGGKIQAMATGGYTGEWTGSGNNHTGRLALLHEKELVLNAEDTKNILKTVSIQRKLTDMMRYNALRQPVQTNKQTINQPVTINASFPNATNRNEIMNAFEGMKAQAVSYISKKV